jgi:hypothetical protein
MKPRLSRLTWVAVCAGLLLAVFALPRLYLAQTSKKAGAMLRSADGHPDLTGVWVAGTRVVNAPKPDGSIDVYLRVPGLDPDSPTVFKGLDTITVEGRAAAPNKPPYKPELHAKVKELSDLQSKLDPAFFCRPPGVPRMGPPNQIIQIPDLIVFLYGDQNTFRVLPTDGRGHRTDVEPSYLGDSVGHWEGDTLVVDVTQFTEDTWLGSDGYFHSSAMRVIERFDRTADTLRYTATVEDANVLTQPWQMNPRTLKLSSNPLDALVENPPCFERDAPHMTTNEHH